MKRSFFAAVLIAGFISSSAGADGLEIEGVTVKLRTGTNATLQRTGVAKFSVEDTKVAQVVDEPGKRFLTLKGLKVGTTRLHIEKESGTKVAMDLVVE